jgi:hypothetical protein
LDVLVVRLEPLVRYMGTDRTMVFSTVENGRARRGGPPREELRRLRGGRVRAGVRGRHRHRTRHGARVHGCPALRSPCRGRGGRASASTQVLEKLTSPAGAGNDIERP